MTPVAPVTLNAMNSGPLASTPTAWPSFQCVWFPNLSRAITLTRISSPAATTHVSPCLLAPTTATSHMVGSAWPDSHVRSKTPPGSGNIVLPNTPPSFKGSKGPLTPLICFFFDELAPRSSTESLTPPVLPPVTPSNGSDRSSVATGATGSSSTKTPREYTPATDAAYRSSQLPSPSSSISQVTFPGPVPCPAKDASPSRRGTLFPNLSMRVTVIASCLPAIHRL